MTGWAGNKTMDLVTGSISLVVVFCLGLLLARLWSLQQIYQYRETCKTLTLKLELQETLSAERARAFEQSKQQLEETFSNLSKRALFDNAKNFLNLASQRFEFQSQKLESDLDTRSQAISDMLDPLHKTLAQTDAHIRQMDKDQSQIYGSIKQLMTQLGQGQLALTTETRHLVSSLRRPEVRGQWGELTLKRIVELAGMVDQCDFFEQVSVETDEQVIRPDMVIRLPENRSLIVDVKTPLDAFLSAHESKDPKQKRHFLKKHASNIRTHIKSLAAKEYWAQFENSPDFVIMFIPGEHFFTAALKEDPKLFDDGLKLKVMIATPTSIISLMKAIAFSWKQVTLIGNAEQIRNLGESFLQRLAVFTEHLAKLGKSLDNSVDFYNRSVGSLDNQVLSAARKLEELGVSPKKKLSDLETIERQARELQGR